MPCNASEKMLRDIKVCISCTYQVLRWPCTNEVSPCRYPKQAFECHPDPNIPSTCSRILSASCCHSTSSSPRLRHSTSATSRPRSTHNCHICDASHIFHPNFSSDAINIYGPAHHFGRSMHRGPTYCVGNLRLPAVQVKECNLLQSALRCSNSDHHKEKQIKRRSFLEIQAIKMWKRTRFVRKLCSTLLWGPAKPTKQLT